MRASLSFSSRASHPWGTIGLASIKLAISLAHEKTVKKVAHHHTSPSSTVKTRRSSFVISMTRRFNVTVKAACRQRNVRQRQGFHRRARKHGTSSSQIMSARLFGTQREIGDQSMLPKRHRREFLRCQRSWFQTCPLS